MLSSLYNRDNFKLAVASKAILKLRLLLLPGFLLVVMGNAADAGAQQRPSSARGTDARENFALAYRLVPGSRLNYELAYETESVSDFNNAVKDPTTRASGPKVVAISRLSHSFRTYLGGELSMTVLKQTADGFLVAYCLTHPVIRFEARGQQNEEQIQAARQELGRPVFAVINLQGRILSFRLDPSLQPLSQNFLRAALSITEFVLPADDASASFSRWETEEEDGNGRYLAQYNQTPIKSHAARRSRLDGPVRWFFKTKGAYLQPAVSRGPSGIYELAPAISSSGGFSARIDLQEGRLLSLEGTETQRFSLAKHVVGQTITTLRLRLTKSESLAGAELIPLQQANAESERISRVSSFFTRPSEEETQTALQRNTLGDATLESLLAALDAPGKAPSSGDTQLYLKFRALAYLHPEVCDQLGRLLSTADPEGRLAQLLPDALAAAGHDQAQATLVSAIRARAADDALLPKLLLALGRSTAPSQLAEDVLREISVGSQTQGVAGLARYLLGNAARSLSSTSPERATRIVNTLVAEIATATSPELIKRDLWALGATSSSRALLTISRFTSDPNPDLRIAAAAALRPFESGEADELLLKLLNADPEAAVRYQCAVTLGERTLTPASLSVQRQVFERDANDDVRLALLDSLWRGRANFPEVVALVKRVSLNDNSNSVKRAAKSLAGAL